MQSVHNTFLDFRSIIADPIESFKRATLPQSFAPISFPPPKPFAIRSSLARTVSALSRAATTTTSAYPQVKTAPKVNAPPPSSNLMTNLPTAPVATIPEASSVPHQPTATTSITTTTTTTATTTQSHPSKSLFFRALGWDLALVHSAAFKESSAAMQARLASPPFDVPLRKYKTAEAIIRAMEKKQQVTKTLVLVEASEAANLLKWLSGRRMEQLLQVVVLGPPRTGGEHAAAAAAFVRDFDAAVKEIECLMTDSMDM